MKLIKKIFRVLSAFVATLAGNWVGEEVRFYFTGKRGHQFRFIHSDEKGETTIAINPVPSNFIPAFVLGLIKRHGWLWSFLVGAAISCLVGENLSCPTPQLPAHVEEE